MKNTIFTPILVASLFFVGIVHVQAELIVNTNTETDQDSPATTIPNQSSNSAQDGAASVTPNNSSNSDQDGHVTTPPVNNGGNGGGGNGGSTPSGSGGSSGSSSGGSFLQTVFIPTVLGVATTSVSTSCPLITDYLKFGGINDPMQVTKLQIFLNNSEKANLEVNGIFDLKTEVAVKNFQNKYHTDVLGPWDATRTTGFVYITTLKKINQLSCAKPFILTDDERAIIESYKARGNSGPTAQAGQGNQVSQVSQDKSENVGTLESNIMDIDNDNVANVVGTSIWARFWNFIKELFR